MVTSVQRTVPIEALLEPGVPGWAPRMLQKMRRYFQPVFAVQPNHIWQVYKADLPPAADWAGCVVMVVDQDCLAFSVGGAWRKISTAGPV